MAEATSPRHGREPDGERRGGAHIPTGGPPAANGEAARLDDWAEQLRVDAASQLRRREQWLRRQAAEDASITGVLVDHAERSSTLAVTTTSGNRHVGRVLGAGVELLTMQVAGARVVIEVGCIETVCALPTGDRFDVDPVGHRSRADDTTMAEVLAMVAGERAEVTLVTRTGQHLRGELEAVGRDVVMMRPPERGPLVYAPLTSVSEALLPASTGSG